MQLHCNFGRFQNKWWVLRQDDYSFRLRDLITVIRVAVFEVSQGFLYICRLFLLE